MKDLILTSLSEASAALEALRANERTVREIARSADMLIGTFRAGGRVFSCGNGGSMSDAMHFAEELTGRYRGNRAGLPAIACEDIDQLDHTSSIIHTSPPCGVKRSKRIQ